MEKEKIKIRKRNCVLKKEINLSGDFLIPDIKPDIINIIGISGFCLVKKDEISTSKIRFDGTWEGFVVYLSDLGEIKSLNTNIDFSENLENEKILSGDEIEYSFKIIKTEGKILNERKVNVSVTFEISVSDYKIEEIDYISNFSDDMEIEKLEKNIVAKKFINSTWTKTSINEDVNLSENGKLIEILNQKVFVSNIEKKISYNKILAKADANIKILYSCENEIKVFQTQIPIMSFIEMTDIKEEYIIDLNYNLTKFLIVNNVAEKNSINCDFEFEIGCDVYEKKELKIIEDLYSLNKDINYSKQNVNIECITDVKNDVFEYSEKITNLDINQIYDYNCSIKSIEKANGNNYEGYLDLDIFYSKEENNSLIQRKLEIPFIINSELDNNEFELDSYEIKSLNNEYICNFKIVSIQNIKYENMEIINDCKFTDGETKKDYSMIIYFVKPQDTIWNISKKFKVSMEKIIELNGITNPNRIIPGEKIYIMRG